MTRAKAKLPAPTFYPLEDLAIEWGCSVARVKLYSRIGTSSGDRLAVTTCDLDGSAVEGVAVDEKRRFESLGAGRTSDAGAMNGVERKSMLRIIGAFACVWAGGLTDPHRKGPTTIYRQLLEAVKEIPDLPGGETRLPGVDTGHRHISDGLALINGDGE